MLRPGVSVSCTLTGSSIFLHAIFDMLFTISRTRFTTRSACGYPIPADSFRFAPWSRDQKPDGKGWFRQQYCLVDWPEVVGGELFF